MINNLKNTILLLGFIGTISVAVSSNVDVKKCPKRSGLFPKPGSLCKAYYKCSNWTPVEELCPEDQLFNPIKGWCDWSDSFLCLEKPKSKECPKDNGRFLKPGTNCKIYYDCCFGKPTEKKCSQDQLFDPSTGKCEWPDLYTCVESLSTEETTQRTLSTIFKISTLSTPDENRDYKTSSQVSHSSPTEIYSTGSSNTDSSSFTDFKSTIQHDLDSSSNTPHELSSSNIQLSSRVLVSSSTIKDFSRFTDFESTSQQDLESSSRLASESTVQPSTRILVPSTTSEPKSGSSDIYEDESTVDYRTPDEDTSFYLSSESSIFSIRTTTPLMKSSTATEGIPYTTPEIKFSETTADKNLNTFKTFRPTEESTVSSSVWDVTSPAIDDIWCPEPFGYFPHPTDKHKFVGCVDSVPSVLTCPSNLVYNHNKRQCDYE